MASGASSDGLSRPDRWGGDWLQTCPFAHRGLHSRSEQRPENSLAAFQAACERGYGIETDVRLTADRRVAVIHDERLYRMTGKDADVNDVTSDALARLRLANTDASVPLLEDVLALVNGRVPLLIECKNPGIHSTLEKTLVAQLRSYSGAVALQSFNPLSVYYLRRLASENPIGQVSGSLSSAPLLIRLVGRSLLTNFLTRPDFLSYELSALRSKPVGFWRRMGLIVIAWTVRSQADEERATRFADNFTFASYTPLRQPPRLSPAAQQHFIEG